MTLGAFIEHRIRVLGIDQTILANRIGRPSSWVSRLINSDSERLPLRADLDALAQALECRRVDLLIAANYIEEAEALNAEECATLYSWLDALHKVQDIGEDERAFIGEISEEAIVSVRKFRRSKADSKTD